MNVGTGRPEFEVRDRGCRRVICLGVENRRRGERYHFSSGRGRKEKPFGGNNTTEDVVFTKDVIICLK